MMQKITKYLSPGFTLLEVLIALTIMGMAITLVLQLFSADLRALTTSGGMISASTRANTRLREILLAPPLAEKSWTEWQEDGYRLDISSREVLAARTDTLPVKLMEISLTIHWSEGNKEKKLTLRTMKMVNKSTEEENRLSLIPWSRVWS